MRPGRARDRYSYNEYFSALYDVCTSGLLFMSGTARPTADFSDALMRHRAYQIRDIGLCAYLVALAAWQRGLTVSFHYSASGKCARFADTGTQGFRGEFFSVSDGEKTCFFRRTLCELISRELSYLCDNKEATRQRLLAYRGIAVPPGIVVEQGDVQAATAFMEAHPDQHFVLKPLYGTRGRGVHRNLAADSVLSTLAGLPRIAHMLEVYVAGPQYRVIVVAGRYVASWENRLPQVTGDGVHTIDTLMAHARAESRDLTHPALVLDDLTLKPDVEAYLRRQGYGPESVPTAGQTVVIWPEPDDNYGSAAVDVTQVLPDAARQAATRAAEALGLPVAGMDVVVDRASGEGVVLEANQMPMIRAMTFTHNGSGQGNRVAEAIIDHYFPDSVGNTRHTTASFDFTRVCQALRSGAVDEVTLPVLGPGWVHRRFRVAAAQVDDKTRAGIRDAMFAHGVHAQLIANRTGDLVVDVLAPEARYDAFVATLGGVT